MYGANESQDPAQRLLWRQRGGETEYAQSRGGGTKGADGCSPGCHGQDLDHRAYQGGGNMNKDQLAGKWRQFRGRIKAEWGKLTDDDLDRISGNYDMLVGKIQETYGKTREEIERRLDQMDRDEKQVHR
jgi:uncharacterized protein YjbJ (UPF0337 family)